MASKTISVRGANVHNLKNVDLDLPRHKLIVFTGTSGSGKSSLAFDTLFAEGQRRYVESMSVYARQFLTRMERPDVKEIRGLAPTISIEQKATSNNPRSTVGTVTEIYDHLRVLWAKLGEQRCYSCNQTLGTASEETIYDALSTLAPDTKFQILAPLVRNRRGEFRDLFESLRQRGITRARVDGEFVRTEEIDILHKETRHTIDAVVDRIVAKPGIEARLRDAIRRALEIADGELAVRFDSGEFQDTEKLYSTHNYCTTCQIAYPPLTHQSFSFNSPLGRCPSCYGLGTERKMDVERLIPDPSLSMQKDAFVLFTGYSNKADRLFQRITEGFMSHHGIDKKTPWKNLPADQKQLLLHGVQEPESLSIPGRKTKLKIAYPGLLGWALELYDTADTEAKAEYYQQYLSDAPCTECNGLRLRAESRSVFIDDASLSDITQWSIDEAYAFFDHLELKGRAHTIGEGMREEITERLGFLRNVGLNYLSLNRQAPSLSGGEAQRIRLASQLGAALSGVLYILDEPSIGLHQRDNDRLIQTLIELRDRRNHVIVVEHDRDTIEAADWVVDFGPGAGTHGGNITFEGTATQLRQTEGNLTGDYLARRKQVHIEKSAKTAKKSKKKAAETQYITIRGAREHNLKDVDVAFPLGKFICVTGVSGAGKSTLINDILFPAAHNHAYDTERRIGVCAAVEGLEHIDRAIRITQSPIGRTPRSNPATYTKVFDEIRKIYSELPESKIYGYKPGRFSFNVGAGRCGHCQGRGVERIEMRFLADVEVTCPVCKGKRFNDATLRVKFQGYSIADLLDLPVEDALPLFVDYPKIRRILETLVDVGLGYITLGQSSTTLSGGEAQRVKLARQLARKATGQSLFILDEPSTGLHFEDIQKLLQVLAKLVETGNTVVVIEHNLDIICAADHIIDIGPEGGHGGGEVVVTGTPEQVAQSHQGYTAPFVRQELIALGRLPADAGDKP